MELSLNLAWIALGALMFCSWLRFSPRAGSSRRMQFVALAVLVLILFPVISVTDDLQAAQNPAETDTCLRRDCECPHHHSIIPGIAAIPVPVFAGLSFTSQHAAIPGSPRAPSIDDPALAPIQNRPPPAA
jgi:hypothetical protein